MVYAIDLPAGRTRFRATVTRANWDPILALRQGDCLSFTAQVACNDDPRPDPNVAATSPLSDLIYAPVGGIVAGRYYLIVDAYSAAGPTDVTARGPFTVAVDVQ